MGPVYGGPTTPACLDSALNRSKPASQGDAHSGAMAFLESFLNFNSLPSSLQVSSGCYYGFHIVLYHPFIQPETLEYDDAFPTALLLLFAHFNQAEYLGIKKINQG